MSAKISVSIIRTVTFLALLSSASSIPLSVNSKDTRFTGEAISAQKSPQNLSRKIPAAIGASTKIQELTDRGLFNLAKGVVTPLSKIANIMLNLAGDQQERRSVPILPDESSLPMISEEKLEFKPRKFHCHPIEDIFIAAVDKMVPAYVCKLESRQFILSSERFREDYKYHLDITVDETTFHHLLIPDDNSTGNSVASVIPVTLTQRRGDEFYGVKRT